MVLSHFLVAETKLFLEPFEQAQQVFLHAAQMAEVLPQDSYDEMMETWPVTLALESFQKASLEVEQNIARAAERGRPSFHLVVCHCKESLWWLTPVNATWLPSRKQVSSTLFIYEKCGRRTEVDMLVKERFDYVEIVDLPDPVIRRDECVGFLKHLVDHYDAPGPADNTIFLQSDIEDHLYVGFLKMVTRAVELHTLNAPFVQLNWPRLVSSLSECKKQVYRLLFEREPSRSLSSYCCAQFLVSRERILARPKVVYERMLSMLDEPSPEGCHDIPGHSTLCLMFEVLWHVLLGEPDQLPQRAEDPRLRLTLQRRLAIIYAAFTFV